ncbi:Intermediate filament protein [Blyttiomyces sp. JEL0837]|nr:Intermediate filament protein [Blyttiomyces sp. JEL0837]
MITALRNLVIRSLHARVSVGKGRLLAMIDTLLRVWRRFTSLSTRFLFLVGIMVPVALAISSSLFQTVFYNLLIFIGIVVMHAWVKAIFTHFGWTAERGNQRQIRRQPDIPARVDNGTGLKSLAWVTVLDPPEFSYGRGARKVTIARFKTILKPMTPVVKHKQPVVIPSASKVERIMEEVVGIMSRRYIRSWTTPLSPQDPVLPTKLENLLAHIVSTVGSRITSVDFVDFVGAKVLPMLKKHISWSKQAASYARRSSKAKSGSSTLDFSDPMVIRHYHGGKVHPAVTLDFGENGDGKEGSCRSSHLRNVVRALMPYICPEAELHSKMFTLLVREIITCLVLRPALDMMIDPDFWNGIFDSLADEAMKQEQTMMKKISEAIEKQVSLEKQVFARKTFPWAFSSADNSFRPIGGHEPTVEDYLDQIDSCTTFADALILLESFTLDIRRRKDEIESLADASGSFPKNRDIKYQLRDLDYAQQKIAHHVRKMEAHFKKSQENKVAYPTMKMILDDPVMTSYFVEFLTLDDPSQIHNIAFWKVVHTLKNQVQALHSGRTSVTSAFGSRPEEGKTALPRHLKEIITRICDLYLLQHSKSRIDIDPTLQSTIKDLCSKLEPQLSPDTAKMVHIDEAIGNVVTVKDLDVFWLIQDRVLDTLNQTEYVKFLESSEFTRLADVLKLDLSVVGGNVAAAAGAGILPSRRSATFDGSVGLKGLSHKTGYDFQGGKNGSHNELRVITESPATSRETFPLSKFPVTADSVQSPSMGTGIGSVAIHRGVKSFDDLRSITKATGSSDCLASYNIAGNRSDEELAESRIAQAKRQASIKRSFDVLGSSQKSNRRKDQESLGSSSQFAEKESDESPTQSGPISQFLSLKNKAMTEIKNFSKKKGREKEKGIRIDTGMGLGQMSGNMADSNDSMYDDQTTPTDASTATSSTMSPDKSSAASNNTKKRSFLNRMSAGAGGNNDESIWAAGMIRANSIAAAAVRKAKVFKFKTHKRGGRSSGSDVSDTERGSTKFSTNGIQKPQTVAEESTPDSSTLDLSPSMGPDGDFGGDTAMGLGGSRFDLTVLAPDRPKPSAPSDLTRDIFKDDVEFATLKKPSLTTTDLVSQADPTAISKVRAELDSVLEKLSKAGEELLSKERIRTLELMKSGLEIEISKMEEDAAQEPLRELESLLHPNCISIAINDIELIEEEGRNYVVYEIEVRCRTLNGMQSSWIVYRRKALNTLMRFRKDFVESRRRALANYLQNTVKHAEVCKLLEFRAFICHPEILKSLYGSNFKLPDTPSAKSTRRSFFRNILHNVDESFDNFVSMIKSPTTVQSITTVNVLRPNNLAPATGSPIEKIATDNPQMFVNGIPSDGNGLSAGMSNNSNAQATSTVDAIFDLFNEVFELRDRGNWLRRQAVNLLLQQLFGGTVERRVIESLRSVVNEDVVAGHLERLRDRLWPNDKESGNGTGTATNNSGAEIRTEDQKDKTKQDAESKLSQLAPELLGGIVGRGNAKRGALKFIRIFQSRPLNEQLVFTLFDEIVVFLFPELD